MNDIMVPNKKRSQGYVMPLMSDEAERLEKIVKNIKEKEINV